jgi:serine/threonine-protein kinase RsbW
VAATPRQRGAPKICRMTMASNPKNVHRVEKFLMNMSSVLKIGDEGFSTLLVVLTEAVNNAIIHGNKGNPAKKVVVTCIREKDGLIVKVKDEGNGFNPDEIPNPIHEENLLRETGRGVFLMRQLMETVHYNKNGNEVTMRMKI